MKSNKFNISKELSSIALIFVIMISTIVPSIADQEIQLPFSAWAMPELNEVEKYGLFPISWYEESLTQAISGEKLDFLIQATDKKIKDLSLPKNNNFIKSDYKSDGSRKEVLDRLYNILAQYNLNDKANSQNIDSIEYLRKNNIIKGDNGSLGLDKKATVEQSIVFAKRLVMHVYEVFDKGSEGFLWEVKNKNNTVYLLGSIHVGENKLYPISKSLSDKYTNSDALILEANPLEIQGLEDFMELSSYTDGTSLKDNISTELYDKTMKVLKENNMPLEDYVMTKPWRIAMDLSNIMMSEDQSMEQAAENAMLGIDMYFLTSALVMDKPIMELEGIKYQAELFDNLSKETQLEYLEGVLDVLLDDKKNPAEKQNLDDWFDYWIDGNVEAFKKSYALSLEEIPNKELTEMLLGKRDKDMADKLAELLESNDSKTYFVVVGSAHLVVDNTVVDQLRSKGYKVNSLND